MSLCDRYSLAIAMASLLTVATCGAGADKLPKDEAARKYRDLVQQLASPNEKAVTNNRERISVKFPEGYDSNAQDRIKEARQVLYDNFEESFPYLIEALDDKRYSMTINWADGSAYYNFSVGDVCRNVLQSRLEAYRDAMTFSNAGHWNRYNYDPFTKDWARLHAGRSLAELQIEAIDWAIAECQRDVLSPGSPKKEIPALKKLRDSIAATGKPAKALSMHPMMTANRRE